MWIDRLELSSVTLVDWIDELFPGRGSVSFELAESVLATMVGAKVGVPTSASTEQSPATNVGRVPVTTAPASPQVQPAPPALTKVTPVGRGSTSWTSVASSGPWLRTVTV